MFNLLIKIIPLDLAATLSPGIFALALVLLGSKFHPTLRTLSLFLGTLLVGVGVNLLGFSLGRAVTIGSNASLASAIIDLLLGSFFIYFGIREFTAKERTIKSEKEEQGPNIAKWIIIGFIISATNFDALFFSFTAAKEVGSSAIGEVSKLIFLIVNLIFFSLPITLPLALYFILPNFASRVLPKINHLVLKYSKYIIFGLFVIFGIVFIWRGLEFFF